MAAKRPNAPQPPAAERRPPPAVLVAGDLTGGYVARWWARGQVVSLRITLGRA
jgi:hypothetical protein